MKPELEGWIRSGAKVVFAFDTNALWSHSKLFEVCNLANQLRSIPPHLDFELVVPAIAHGEHLLHIRHELGAKGRNFEIGKFRIDLERKGLRVQTFDSDDAERVAELIAFQHGDAHSWREAKRQLAIQRLHLSAVQASEAPGLKFAATVDWLIAGQAANNRWLLVTDDQGPEFQSFDYKTDFGSLQKLLQDLLAERRDLTGA